MTTEHHEDTPLRTFKPINGVERIRHARADTASRALFAGRAVAVERHATTIFQSRADFGREGTDG
jgi:hypothetical protein